MTKDPIAPASGYNALSATDRRFAGVAADPRLAVYAAVAGTAALGWIYLVVMMLGSGDNPAALGPGMQILQGFEALKASPLLMAICQPIGLSANAEMTFASFGLTFAMWAMMVLAMMLPTAAPMLSTYATLANTASEKSEPAASVGVLAAGYLVVWLLFSMGAAMAQSLLSYFGGLTISGTPATLTLAAAVLLAASLYQFTPAKLACLTKCQNPFMFFFANWTAEPVGIFKLGLVQGLYCLGCCWALMSVMFAVGVMNLVWVAFLSGLMVLEKTVVSPWMSRAIGLFLFVLALLLLKPVFPQDFMTG